MTSISKFISNFKMISSKGEVIEVPSMVKTYHSLSKFILRDYLAKHDYDFSHIDRVQFMMDVIENQEVKFSLWTCTEPISLAVVNSYTIFKKNGLNLISNRDKKQLSFIIRKMLEVSIQEAIL